MNTENKKRKKELFLICDGASDYCFWQHEVKNLSATFDKVTVLFLGKEKLSAKLDANVEVAFVNNHYCYNYLFWLNHKN